MKYLGVLFFMVLAVIMVLGISFISAWMGGN